MMMPNLPKEVIEEILVRLPTKPLVRFRCVAKSWNTLLTDPIFFKKQLNRSIIGDHHGFILHPIEDLFQLMCEKHKHEEDLVNLQVPAHPCFNNSDRILIERSKLKLVGSCNGIVCLTHADTDDGYTTDGYIFHLWNPLIGDYKILPVPIFYYPPCVDALGFGFNPTINDYKVVRVLGYGNFHPKLVEVYSLAKDCWSKLEVDVPTLYFHGYSTVNVNGFVHWLVHNNIFIESNNSIVSFDMDREVFQVVDLPDDSICSAGAFSIFSYKECLSIVVKSVEKFDVWVMKEYGVRESWIKQFSVDRAMGGIMGTIEHIIEFSTKDEVLLMDVEQGVACYNLESGEVKKIRLLRWYLGGYSEAVSYIPSCLLSLKLYQRTEARETQNDYISSTYSSPTFFFLLLSFNLRNEIKTPSTTICCSSSSPSPLPSRSHAYNIPKLEPFSRRSKLDRSVKEPSLIEKSESQLADYCSKLEGDSSYSCWNAYLELKHLEQELPKEDVEKLVRETQGVKNLIPCVHAVASVHNQNKTSNNSRMSATTLNPLEKKKEEAVPPVPDWLPRSQEEIEEEDQAILPDSAYTRLLRTKGSHPAWYSAAPDHETD